MNTKRITFILGSLARGGAEKVISTLSRDYAEKGWNTDIILLLFNAVEYDINPTTRIIDFSGNTQSRIKRLPYWLKSIRRYVIENKPDVVLSFAARINIISQVACENMVNKFYVSERNDPYCDGRSKFIDIATNILYPRTDGVIFQTRRAASYFPKLDNGTIIANPITVSSVAAKKKTNKIVTIGRLNQQKNQKMLIESFALIVDKYPGYILEIFGDGGLKQELKNQIAMLGLNKKVVLRGNVSNIHEQIADAKLFVLSSNYEGLSNALLEAMMMGLPCISTDCAGSDEYIRNGENGLLIPIEDGYALAEAMDKMLSDDELRIKCGLVAARDSSKYSKRIVLKQWHDLLD